MDVLELPLQGCEHRAQVAAEPEDFREDGVVVGDPTILRSYIACREAEGLSLAQLEDPAETVVITEKWGKDLAGKAVTDKWIEPFNGDFNCDPASGRLALAANRHQGHINAVLFDGHAKSFTPGALDASKDLTGCT